jgi:hypothetical protein
MVHRFTIAARVTLAATAFAQQRSQFDTADGAKAIA